MRKEERELRRLAKRHGFRLRRTKGDHFAFVSETGGIVAVTGSSPSDHRTHRNLESQLKLAVSRGSLDRWSS